MQIEEMQKRRTIRTLKTTTAGTLSSMSFAAAILSNWDLMKRPDLNQERGQSVWDPIGNSSFSDDILRATTVVQHIMTELKKTDSEQVRIMAITKIVLHLMNKNGLLPRRTHRLTDCRL
jgi:hypothetical protein